MRNYVIALYIRLSVEDFKTESLSIPNQKLILREKAMSLPEWDNSEILEFIDNGHTGTNFERPAVQELLTMVQAGKINCIIVKDLSRFGRNSIEMLQLSVSLCQIKNRVIICSAVRYSVDAAIMQCLYEMVRGFIAVIPRWLKRFLVMVCA